MKRKSETSYLKDIICCGACGVGKFTIPQETVQKQKEKYGEYVCQDCETKLETILNSEEELTEDGFGKPCETLITEDRILRLDHRGNVMNPNNSMLGFGGAWHLITKNYGRGNRKVFVSNSLWHVARIPTFFQSRFKEKNKVNATVVGLYEEQLIDLKKQLNNISYLSSDKKAEAEW